MTHSSVLALAALALLVAPLTTARAAKPQPAPTITAITFGSARFSPDHLNSAIWAAASDGKIYAAPATADEALPGSFQEVGQVPGRPVSIMQAGLLHVSLENGDVYKLASLFALPPYTFTFVGNIFTQAGTGARLPAFPDLAPFEDARPILTGNGAQNMDGPEMVK